MPKPSFTTISRRQKIGLVLFGLFLSLVLLEGGLRLGGFVIMQMKGEHRNISLSDPHEFRILCLGESTTFSTWPHYLEEILNEKAVSKQKFIVINKAKAGTNTGVIASQMDEYLDTYEPHMVIGMMGINDIRYTVKYEGTTQNNILLFLYDFRLCKLARLLWKHVHHALAWVRPAYALSDETNYVGQHDDEQYARDYEKVRADASFEQSIISEYSDEEHALLDEAWKLEQKKSWDEAEIKYKEIIINNEKNVSAFLYLGWLYIKCERYQEAEYYLSEARTLYPEYSEPYVRLGWCYRDQKQFDKAVEMFKKGLELKPDARNYVEYGLCLFYARRYDEALALLLEAQKRFPENGFIYGEIAACYDVQRKAEEAVIFYDKALEYEPEDVSLMFRLATVCLDYHKYDRVIELYNRARPYFRERAYLFQEEFKLFSNLVASCYIMQKKYTEAEALYLEAIKSHPNEPTYYAGLGLAYFNMGKDHLARKAYAKADDLRDIQKADFLAVTKHNYNVIREKVHSRKIPLVCVQYPMRSVEPLKNMFKSHSDILFVDNEHTFKDAVRARSYNDIFIDNFAVDFGHCTEEGYRLLAQNVADVLLEEYFNE